MKRLVVVVISIVVAVACVAIGWAFGFEQRLLTEGFAVPTVDKHLSDAMDTFNMLQQLNSGKIQDAKEMLRLQLQVDILTINGFIRYADPRTRQTAWNLFAEIAEDRADHRNVYTGSLPHVDAKTAAKVASILQKARQEETK